MGANFEGVFASDLRSPNRAHIQITLVRSDTVQLLSVIGRRLIVIQQRKGLPSPFDLAYDEIKSEFTPRGAFARIYLSSARAFEMSEAFGSTRVPISERLERGRLAKTFIVALRMAEAWKESDFRKVRLADKQRAFRQLGPKPTPNHIIELRWYTTAGADEFEDFVAYGFFLRCGAARVSMPLVRPLVPAILNILHVRHSSSGSPDEQVYQLIRQRVARQRRRLGESVLRIVSASWFSRVYETLHSSELRL